MNTPDVQAAKKLQELKEQQAIIQAYLDGKTIECKLKAYTGDDNWSTTSEPVWAFAKLDYRVKNEPRTFYINFIKGTGKIAATYLTEAEAVQHAARYGRDTIKVIEVL